jgi:hypothetical protein
VQNVHTRNGLWRPKTPDDTKEIKYKNERVRTFGAASTFDHIETTPSLFVIVAKVVPLRVFCVV